MSPINMFRNMYRGELLLILYLVIIAHHIVPSVGESDYEEDAADDDFNYYDDAGDNDEDYDDEEFGYGDVYTFEDDDFGEFASSSSQKKPQKADVYAKDDFQLAQKDPADDLHFKSNVKAKPYGGHDSGAQFGGLHDDHKEYNPRDKHPGAGISNDHERMDKTHDNLFHDRRYDGDHYGGVRGDTPPHRQGQGQIKPRKSPYDQNFEDSHVNHIPAQYDNYDNDPFLAKPRAPVKKSPFGGGFHSHDSAGAPKPLFGSSAGQRQPAGPPPKPKPPFLKAVPVHAPVEERFDTDIYDTGDDGGGLHFSSGKDTNKASAGSMYDTGDTDFIAEGERFFSTRGKDL